jgi:hypothetical protein
MESKELIVQTESNKSVSLFDQRPAAMVQAAVEMANVLKDVIEKQGLFSDIQGKKYVKCEGWQTLGIMLGILPKEKDVKELADGSYEASVELVSMRNGMVVGCGSALCGMDEKRWSGSQKYARRSMAITRATGKAYRISFGWIMNLAGYQSTPAEEMPEQIPFAPTRQAPNEFYTETDTQKKQFARWAKEFGIADKTALSELSSFCKNKPMSEIKGLIGEYLKNPFAENKTDPAPQDIA